jgi:hypothetical protein
LVTHIYSNTMKYFKKLTNFEKYGSNPYYKEKYLEIKKLESILDIRLDWKKIKSVHIDHLNDLIISLKNQIK